LGPKKKGPRSFWRKESLTHFFVKGGTPSKKGGKPLEKKRGNLEPFKCPEEMGKKGG